MLREWYDNIVHERSSNMDRTVCFNEMFGIYFSGQGVWSNSFRGCAFSVRFISWGGNMHPCSLPNHLCAFYQVGWQHAPLLPPKPSLTLITNSRSEVGSYVMRIVIPTKVINIFNSWLFCSMWYHMQYVVCNIDEQHHRKWWICSDLHHSMTPRHKWQDTTSETKVEIKITY